MRGRSPGGSNAQVARSVLRFSLSHRQSGETQRPAERDRSDDSNPQGTVVGACCGLRAPAQSGWSHDAVGRPSAGAAQQGRSCCEAGERRGPRATGSFLSLSRALSLCSLARFSLTHTLCLSLSSTPRRHTALGFPSACSKRTRSASARKRARRAASRWPHTACCATGRGTRQRRTGRK